LNFDDFGAFAKINQIQQNIENFVVCLIQKQQASS
jgi:hypothetical protein